MLLEQLRFAEILNSGAKFEAFNVTENSRFMPKNVAFRIIVFCMIVILILITKPTRCTNFSNLIWNKTLHVSGSSSVRYQQLFTVHTVMVYVIQVCWQLASRIMTEPVPSWSCSQAQDGPSSVLNLLSSCQQTRMTYTIAVCTVKNSWWWTEELSEMCRVLLQK